MKKRNSMDVELPKLTFICVSTKMKQREGTIDLDEVIKRFSRNRTCKPILDKNILKTILKNQQLIPKGLQQNESNILILCKRRSKKYRECIDGLNYDGNNWREIRFYPVDYYCEGDYVICAKN
jgi:hypothetical protein